MNRGIRRSVEACPLPTPFTMLGEFLSDFSNIWKKKVSTQSYCHALISPIRRPARSATTLQAGFAKSVPLSHRPAKNYEITGLTPALTPAPTLTPDP
jgi:hypothetical protein